MNSSGAYSMQGSAGAALKPEVLRARKRRRETRAYLLRLGIGILFLSPLAIGLLFSFVPNEYLSSLPTFKSVFNNLTLDNYRWVFKNIPVLTYAKNSFIMSVIVIVMQILLASFAAYAFSFFEFKGRDFFFRMVLTAMMIPGTVVVITNFLFIQELGLLNTYLGLTMKYFVGGTAIFMMRQFFKTIPLELKDAAEMDGCGEMRFLFTVAMPLAVPMYAALTLFLFIDMYNAYLWPLLVAQRQEMQTVQIGMAMIVDAEFMHYGYILAGAIVSIIVPLVVFLIGQDYLVRGMMAGAVKG